MRPGGGHGYWKSEFWGVPELGGTGLETRAWKGNRWARRSLSGGSGGTTGVAGGHTEVRGLLLLCPDGGRSGG